MDLVEYVAHQAVIDMVDLIVLYRFNSVTIPQKDDPRHMAIAKRCESRRPMGMFRSAENEFLLCYDGLCFPRSPITALQLTLLYQNSVFTLIGTAIQLVDKSV